MQIMALVDPSWQSSVHVFRRLTLLAYSAPARRIPISDVATFEALARNLLDTAKSRLVCWPKKQFESSAEPYEQTGEIYDVRSVKLCRIPAQRGPASPSLTLFGNSEIVMRGFYMRGMATAAGRSDSRGRRYETVCRNRRQGSRPAVPTRTKLLHLRIVGGGHTDETSVGSHG
jgi:hypothetical protein